VYKSAKADLYAVVSKDEDEPPDASSFETRLSGAPQDEASAPI
jgi:hypothetical protein